MSAEARDTGLPGDGVTGGGEPPYMGCWEKNSSRLQEQSASNQPLLFSQHSLKNAAFSPLSYTCRPQESVLCKPLSSLWNL